MLSGWGNFSKSTASLFYPETFGAEYTLPQGTCLARGLGRSYGDAALNEQGNLLMTEKFGRILDLTPSGVLTATAGSSLEEIIRYCLPKGFFLPVTPGTQYVTLGGCIAADVHGKNHHIDGSFSRFVEKFTLMLCNGTIVTCSPEVNAPLFHATVGGMGLTGIILEVVLRLIPVETAYIRTHYRNAKDLSHNLELLSDRSIEDRYSVSWVDCRAGRKNFGRGVLMTGRHAGKEDLQSIADPFVIPRKREISIPFYFPDGLLNSSTARLFNACFYAANKNKGVHIKDYAGYFYPLDTVKYWNRVYGKRGFIQYQFVVPEDSGRRSIGKILQHISDEKRGSFLAVLKRFGPGNDAPLSFPKEGITLALDIPMRDPGLISLVEKLDRIVADYGGRVYLAKDSLLSPEMFREMYPRFNEWLAVKREYDPHCRFDSDLSRRLALHDL